MDEVGPVLVRLVLIRRKKGYSGSRSSLDTEGVRKMGVN